MAHAAKDLAAIDVAMEKLNTAWTAASTDMYNAQQQGGASNAEETAGDTTKGSTKEDVTDVDYEEVK
jgi:molecular chaperone DnaK